MRLTRVRIARFWDEQDLLLEPARRDDDVGLVFLIGPNGAGKSRLLECLGQIFSRITLGMPVGLDFDVEYELDDQRVLITTRPGAFVESTGTPPRQLPGVDVWVLAAPLGTEPWNIEHLRRSAADVTTVLPARVVGVSSGPVSRFRAAFGQLPDAVADGVLDEEAEAAELEADSVRAHAGETRCIALAGPELALAPLALLAGQPVASAREAVVVDVLRQAGVADDGLIAFSLDFAGDWRQRAADEHEMVQYLLWIADRRVEIPLSTAADDPDEVAVRGVYELSSRTREQLGRFVEDPLPLFDRLLGWYQRGVIREVRLVLKRRDRVGLVDGREFSDGEFLLLGRYCLLLLLRAAGGVLMLLDEPETHFNDQWKVEFVQQLIELLQVSDQRDEVLVATHSDLTLTDALPREVYLIEDRWVRPTNESSFAADRTRIRTSARGTPLTGERARRSVDEALAGDIERKRALLEQVGPGFAQFRLAYAIRKEDGDAA